MATASPIPLAHRTCSPLRSRGRGRGRGSGGGRGTPGGGSRRRCRRARRRRPRGQRARQLLVPAGAEELVLGVGGGFAVGGGVEVALQVEGSAPLQQGVAIEGVGVAVG